MSSADGKLPHTPPHHTEPNQILTPPTTGVNATGVIRGNGVQVSRWVEQVRCYERGYSGQEGVAGSAMAGGELITGETRQKEAGFPLTGLIC